MDHLLFNQLAGNIGWKDKQLRHLGCNANMAALLDFKHAEQIIGLSDADLFYPDAAVELYYQHDQLALSGKIVRQVHLYQDAYHFITKKPLLNSDQQIEGVVYHCQPLGDAEFIANLAQTDKKYHTGKVSYQVAPADNPFHLSKRELQCMFHLLRGKTSKEIAQALQLSKRTIDFYLDNIKNKFGCQNKAALIVAGVEAGYLKYIP